MRKRVLSFGETLWELLPSGPVLGGAPLNLAYRLQSLGERATLVTRLGRDDLGRQAWQSIARLGIATEHVQWDGTWPTGTVLISTDDRCSSHELVVPRVAFDFIEVTDPLSEAAKDADCVCFGALCHRAPTTRRTLASVLAECPGLKVLDLRLAGAGCSRDSIVAAIERADVLMLSEEDANHLARLLELFSDTLPAIAHRLLRGWPLSYCVITLGDRGVLAAHRSGECVYVRGYQVPVADSRGAGDAFTAGFIHRMLQGQSLRECCRLGAALRAIVSTQPGALAPITSETIRRFVENPPPRLRHDEFCERVQA